MCEYTPKLSGPQCKYSDCRNTDAKRISKKNHELLEKQCEDLFQVFTMKFHNFKNEFLNATSAKVSDLSSNPYPPITSNTRWLSMCKLERWSKLTTVVLFLAVLTQMVCLKLNKLEKTTILKIWCAFTIFYPSSNTYCENVWTFWRPNSQILFALTK